MDTPELPHWTISWGNFIKAHEKLVIIVLAAFLLFKTGQGIENIILKHDQKQADKATDTVKQDESANKVLLDQLAGMKADAASQTENLNKQISDLRAQLVKQKAKDAVSTPTEIDARWLQLLPLRPGSVSTLDATTTKITNESANETVQALEELPVLRTQVSDLASEVDTRDKIIVQQDETITGLGKQIVDEKASHVADVKLEKAKAKHGFWKGFKIGVVVGVVGGEAIRIWAGHP